MSKFKTLYDNDIIKVEEYQGVYRVSFFNEDYECVESYVYCTSAVDNVLTEEEREGDISNEAAIDAIDILEKMYREKENDPSKMVKEESNKVTKSLIDYIDIGDTGGLNGSKYNAYIPNCCKHCPNHPSNGGSGVCNCTAPLFDNDNTSAPHWTTWATSNGAERYTATHNTNRTED